MGKYGPAVFDQCTRDRRADAFASAGDYRRAVCIAHHVAGSEQAIRPAQAWIAEAAAG
jgi:hypothetical protein